MAAAAVRSSPIPPPLGVGNKRKRGNEDMGRNVKVTNPNDQDVYTTSMLQGLSTSADDESTRNAAQAALAGTMGEMYPETGYDSTAALTAAFGAGTPPNLDTSGQAAYGTPGQTPSKPAVGTPQWHQQRKENHKEVERRRREVINEGIENIAKIVPGTEKNKGAILQRTAQYIQELQEQVAKFPAERSTLDVAIKELTKRIDQSRDAVKQAWQESKKWQQRCREAGLSFDDYDDLSPDFDALGAADLDVIEP